ncbi:MAG: hypothetical protein R3A11_05725 [Bdellovibrionota bacterium]
MFHIKWVVAAVLGLTLLVSQDLLASNPIPGSKGFDGVFESFDQCSWALGDKTHARAKYEGNFDSVFSDGRLTHTDYTLWIGIDSALKSLTFELKNKTQSLRFVQINFARQFIKTIRDWYIDPQSKGYPTKTMLFEDVFGDNHLRKNLEKIFDGSDPLYSDSDPYGSLHELNLFFKAIGEIGKNIDGFVSKDQKDLNWNMMMCADGLMNLLDPDPSN